MTNPNCVEVDMCDNVREIEDYEQRPDHGTEYSRSRSGGAKPPFGLSEEEVLYAKNKQWNNNAEHEESCFSCEIHVIYCPENSLVFLTETCREMFHHTVLGLPNRLHEL